MTQNAPHNRTEGLPDDVWQRLPLWDKNKLRAGYTLAICTEAISKDLKIFLLNLAFVGVALIPGPGAVLTLPLFLASYFVRWDKNARETRAKFKDFFKNGVPMERYHEFIHPALDGSDTYRVHTKQLLKAKFDVIKHNTIEVNKTALQNIGRIYEAVIYEPITRLLHGVQLGLEPVIGEKRADQLITPLFNNYAKLETKICQAASYVGSKADKAGHWIEKEIVDIFNASAAVGNELARQIDEGWDYNKKEIGALFRGRFGL
jgi:hypothetical protein